MEKINDFRKLMTEETDGQTVGYAITFLAKLVFVLILVLFNKKILTNKDIESITELLKE